MGNNCCTTREADVDEEQKMEKRQRKKPVKKPSLMSFSDSESSGEQYQDTVFMTQGTLII